MKPGQVLLGALVVLIAGCAPAAQPTATAVPTPARATRTPPPPATPIPTVSALSAYGGRPLAADQGALFSGSGRCVTCHRDMQDDAGADVSIDSAWRASMEANAARDPYFQAMAEAEAARFPEQAAAMQDTCARCHMPMAQTTLALGGESAGLFSGGLLDPDHELNGLALDGVSCALCHQIQEKGLGFPESYSGGYSVDPSTGPGQRLIYGPYLIDEQQAERMQSESGYAPAQGLHIIDSELCATCHMLFSSYLDRDGQVAGEFAFQATYFEWYYSSYRRAFTCQDCHMPEAQGGVHIANTSEYPRSPFAQHTFVGGNATMLGLLTSFAEELELPASGQELQQARARTEQYLQAETARVTLEEIRLSGSRLTVDVLVESQAGHKLPTGFPSRRAWLRFAVNDADGNLVFESGGWDASGRITANANDDDPGTYEPHYQAIVQPEQVQIYEAVLRDSDGLVTTSWMRAAGYLKDNRLLPLGFDPFNQVAAIQVVGRAAEDPDFYAGQDRIQYSMDLGAAPSPFTITVELLFQPIGYAWTEALRQMPTPLVDRFLGLFDQISNAPLVLDRQTLQTDPQ